MVATSFQMRNWVDVQINKPITHLLDFVLADKMINQQASNKSKFNMHPGLLQPAGNQAKHGDAGSYTSVPWREQ